jgi:hypothetical protein
LKSWFKWTEALKSGRLNVTETLRVQDAKLNWKALHLLLMIIDDAAKCASTAPACLGSRPRGQFPAFQGQLCDSSKRKQAAALPLPPLLQHYSKFKHTHGVMIDERDAEFKKGGLVSSHASSHHICHLCPAYC